MALTLLQENFIAYYLADPKRCGKTAAIKAGYSEKRAAKAAWELMRNEEILIAIREKELAAAEAANVDVNYVLTRIRQIIERCTTLGKGFNPNAALKGLELLGRYHSMWKDRVEVDDVSDLAERIRQAWKEESGGLTDGTEAMGGLKQASPSQEKPN